MDDLISRQAAIDALDKGAWGVEWDKALAKAMIESLPPAQPEIVRCKDCKHYRHGLCMKASMCVNKSENGFCDWAERREVTT